MKKFEDLKLPESQREFTKFFRKLVNHPTYLAAFELAFIQRQLPARLEEMVWERAAGKVPDRVEISGGEEDLTQLTSQELASRAALLSRKALELEENEKKEREKAN